MHDDGDRRLKSVFGDAVAVMVLVPHVLGGNLISRAPMAAPRFQVLADGAHVRRWPIAS